MKKGILITWTILLMSLVTACDKKEEEEIVTEPKVKEIAKNIMVTKWNAVSLDGDTYIAINTKGGGKFQCKKEGDDKTVLVEGTLENEKKIKIDLNEFGEGKYIVEITPLSVTDSMVLLMGQVAKEEAEALLEISQWGNFSKGTNASSMVSGCSNLVITAKDIPDFSKTTDMSNMFYNCSSITDVPNINNWNVSKVTDMLNMFTRAYQFNAPIGSWDTSSVTNMTRMFAQAFLTGESEERAKGKFNQDISKWDVSNVLKMETMFRSCVDFNQDLSSWNVAKVIKTSSMFEDATSFNGNISDWDVSKVYDMTDMFLNAVSFNQSLNWNTSEVNNFTNMFKGASSFNQSLATFQIVKSYKDMTGMLDNTALSCSNYNATLKSWAKNENTRTRRKFSAVGLTYSDKTSHDKLISEKGWNILDGDIYDANCSK